MNSGDSKREHETSRVSKEKLSCSLVSRVGALEMSMAQKFLFSRDISCKISVESRPLSRTTSRWPEGHGLGSSEGDDDHSVS